LIPIFDEALIPEDPFSYKMSKEAEEKKDLLDIKEDLKLKEQELEAERQKLEKEKGEMKDLLEDVNKLL
jgi:flagellar motility protein MotE (MotC chaperone)